MNIRPRSRPSGGWPQPVDHMKYLGEQRSCRELKLLRARHGRLICDIRRKTAHDQTLRQVFTIRLAKAGQIRRRQRRGRKLYSWHAPETESSTLVLRRPLAK